MLIAYVHGFLSTSNAVKAGILRRELKRLRPDINFVSFDFPDTPKEAFDTLCTACRSLQQHDRLCLVGSSMGGFFATALSVKFGLKAVLLNPCTHPQHYFSSLIGNHVNPISGKSFELTPKMLPFLRELDERNSNFNPKKLKVFLQSGDEVLDYRLSLDFYSSANPVVISGGCHAFDGFANIVPSIVEFCLSN